MTAGIGKKQTVSMNIFVPVHVYNSKEDEQENSSHLYVYIGWHFHKILSQSMFHLLKLILSIKKWMVCAYKVLLILLPEPASCSSDILCSGNGRKTLYML